MIIFLISFLITVLMFFEKVYFFQLENSFNKLWVARLEVMVLLFIIVYSTYLYVKNNTPIKPKIVSKKKWIPLLFIFGSIFYISLTLYLNYTKISIHWDAVALYEARANFLSNGIKFSEMTNFGEFDNLNKYYYLLYPPYTSIAHYLWRASGIITILPLSVYYSLVLILISIIYLFIIKREFGILPASVVTFLVVSNGSIFNVSIKEYTNLPFDLYIVAGVLLIYSFIGSKEFWEYLVGITLVATSMWIRFLEPIWLAILLAYAISAYNRKDLSRHFYLVVLFFGICLLEYLSWSFFANNIAKNPGFLSFNYINLLDPIFAIFTGAPVVIMANMAKNWLIPFVIHLLTLVGAIFNYRKFFKNTRLKFLILVNIISFLVYFGEFYIVSFQYDWWSIVTMSLDRSATFMIPISALILLEVLSNKK